MVDIDFDELDKKIKNMSDSKDIEESIGNGRRSTGRRTRSLDRHDTKRDEGVSINVSITKKPLGKPKQIVSTGSAVNGIFVAPHNLQSNLVIDKTTDTDLSETEHQIRVEDAHESLDKAIISMEESNSANFDPEEEIHEVIEESPVDEDEMAELGVDELGNELDEIDNIPNETEPSPVEEIPDHKFEVAEDGIDAISANTIDITNTKTVEHDLIGEPPMLDDLDQEESQLSKNDIRKQKKAEKKAAKKVKLKPVKEDVAINSKSNSINMVIPKKGINIWDIIYYLIVGLLIITILYLVVLLLHRFDLLNLPSSLPFVE